MIPFVIHIVHSLGVLTLLMVGVVIAQRKMGSINRLQTKNAIVGMLFGLVIVLVMLDPIKLAEGGVFDPRGGPAILAGVFAGPVGALIATILGSVARVYLIGGPFALGGVVGFVLYGAFGVVAGMAIKKHKIKIGPYVLLGLGLFGSLAVVPAFFVNADFETGIKILEKAGPVLLINNVVGTFIVGMFVLQANRWQIISQRLESEQANNLRLARIAQNTTNGIIVTDEYGTTEWVNSSFEEMTGYGLHEVYGRRLGGILQGPDSDPDVIEEMSRKIKNKEDFDVTLVNYHKNGQAYFVHIDCQTYLDADGALKFMAVENDVTAQVLAQKELRKSEKRFKDFAEASSDWLWEMDADDRVLFVSDRIEAITGERPSSFIGKTREELTGEDYYTEKWDELREAIAARKPIKGFQYARSGANGTEIKIAIHGIPFYDEDGVFGGYRGTGSDITKQQAIYDRAVEAEQKLLTAIESLEDGFVLFDADDRLVLCNEKYKETYELSRDLLTPGRKFSDIIQIAAERGQFLFDGEHLDEWVSERIAGHALDHSVFEKKMPNGQWLKISESRTPQGGIVGYHVDVTQLKTAQQSAEAANLAKSNFLSTMSHEIRTPLNGVLGLAQLLMDTDLDDDQRQKVNTILSSGQTLLVIINDVLDMSKIEAGGIELENQAFSLNSLFSSMTALFQSLADGKGVELEINYQLDPELFVKGDSVRIRQILWNLLSNAIKFTDEGRVALRVEECTEYIDGVDQHKDHLLCFSVEDTGLGIAPERIGAIFDAFTQEDNSISRKFGGTGLGLSIVKQLTEMMGGTISVHSTLGEGTVFDVYIPFDDATATDSEVVALRNTQNSTEKAAPLKVLIAEDNDVNAMIARSFLEKFGHEVRHAVNGKLVVEAAKDGWADLILMDIHMPEMDGIDATKEIRKTKIGKTLPIVGLTAEAFAERHALFLEAGMNGVLTKPFTELQLAETLAVYRNDERLCAPQNVTEDANRTEELTDLTENITTSESQILEPQQAEPPTGDVARLEEMRDQLTPAIVATLLQQAQEMLQETLLELRQAVTDGDGNVIRDKAHAIKGASGSMFASHLSELAATMEQNAQDIGEVSKSMPAFEIAAAKTLDWWREQEG